MGKKRKDMGGPSPIAWPLHLNAAFGVGDFDRNGSVVERGEQCAGSAETDLHREDASVEEGEEVTHVSARTKHLKRKSLRYPGCKMLPCL